MGPSAVDTAEVRHSLYFHGAVHFWNYMVRMLRKEPVILHIRVPPPLSYVVCHHKQLHEAGRVFYFHLKEETEAQSG